jgi:hypothetical protein
MENEALVDLGVEKVILYLRGHESDPVMLLE